MRKLIITVIISVIAMIAWISYLKYDTKRFIADLTLSSPDEKQQLNSTVVNNTGKDTEVTLADGVANTKQSQRENTSASLPEGKAEDVGQAIVIEPNRGKNSEVLESDQIPKGTGLSPEVVELYSELSVIYDEYVRVFKEYIPLSKQLFENTQRYNNFGQEFGAISGDTEKVDTLEAEHKRYNCLVKSEYAYLRKLTS